MPTKPTAISLFSGAGGLDYGFEAAGFDTRVAIENDPDCCKTLRANRPKWPVIEKSIFDVSPRTILKEAGVHKRKLDAIIGGPPCQPFSRAGYWAAGDAARMADTRADTIAAYMNVVEYALPRVVFIENVDAFAYRNKSEGLDAVLARFKRINAAQHVNYQPKHAVVDAADYGVPQHRRRLVLIAERDGLDFRFPERTHAAAEDLDELPHLAAYHTAWDALGDVEPGPDENLGLTGKWADLLPSIPEGHNYSFHTERGQGLKLFGWRTKYWSFLLKLAKKQPSWTVAAQPGPANGPFHWSNRRLSMRELCRLQTFPDGVVVQGSRLAVQRQIGNAVPSLLAEVFAREIRRQLLGHRISSIPKLMPTRRADVPRTTPARPVDPKYLHLEGTHAAHPGTGKGPRAQLLWPEAEAAE